MTSHLTRWSLAICLLTLGLAAAYAPPVRADGCAQRRDDDPEPKDKKKKKKSSKSGKSAKGKSDKDGDKGSKRKKSDEDHLKPFPSGIREDLFKAYVGDGFKVHRTDHFTVLYDADKEIVRDFITRLERTYESVHRFAAKAGIEIHYPEEKLIVIFCRSYDEFDRLNKQIVGQSVPPNVAGLYWSHPINFSIFYDFAKSRPVLEVMAKVERLQEEARKAKDRATRKAKSREARFYLNYLNSMQDSQNRSVVQHEVTHQLMFNFQVHAVPGPNPQWFAEGLATQFEPPPGKMGAGSAVINQRRLQVFREAYEKGGLDLRQFVAKHTPTSGMLSDEGYAVSWALTNYLIRRKKESLQKYITLIKERDPAEPFTPDEAVELFEGCFGKLDERFQSKFRKYTMKLPYRPSR
ncbi:MAG: DUF1570 domain-containing protein [Planctomycetota bacterium]